MCEQMAQKNRIRVVKKIKIKKNSSFSRSIVKKFIHHNHKLASNLNKTIDLPKENESIHIITQNQFNAFTFIPLISKKEEIKYIYLSTYSISKKTINALSEMLEKGIIRGIHLVISTFITNSKKESADCLELTKKKHNNFTYISRHNHSKIILIETNSHYYVVEGSGNLTMNGRIEQYVFSCSEDLYNFHKEWMLTI